MRDYLVNALLASEGCGEPDKLDFPVRNLAQNLSRNESALPGCQQYISVSDSRNQPDREKSVTRRIPIETSFFSDFPAN